MLEKKVSQGEQNNLFEVTPIGMELTAPTQQDHKILIEQIEDAQMKREILLKMDAIEDIQTNSDNGKQERIRQWAQKLGKHPRTITRMLSKADIEGLAAIIKTKRADAGKRRGKKQWQPSVEYWVNFIEKTYRDGNKNSRRMNRNQVYNQVKGHAELELGLKESEYPSHVFVYQVLAPLVEKKKVRHPGQGSRIVIKTTAGELVVERSNQVWQIDHTRLDTLLVDENLELAGSLYITVVIDSYSGCAMGFYLGFEAAGSHEVALALRHAILAKQYPPDYQIQHEWMLAGLPEYIVTDRAKEFRSGHLRRIAMDLNIQLRLRAYPQQGGLIESLFDKANKEVLSMLPGYKGSNVQKRPLDAEKYACITYEEFEKILTRYFVDHYNQHLYPRVKNQTRIQRWWAGLIGKQPKLLEERELDICLMKTVPRCVQAYGCVQFECLIYSATWLQKFEGQQVTLRYNPSNIVTLLVYSVEKNNQASVFLGTVKARDLDEERLSLKEWKAIKQKVRSCGKTIDQSSILSERLALNEFAQEKIRTLKQRRASEQKRINRKSVQSKVIELFPEENETTVVLEKETDAPELSQQSAINLVSEPKQQCAKSSQSIAYDWNQIIEENW
ncbi:Integrase, catalytic region (plasmid) [Trichormus variabilis ATCC 29413]|uniref:Integrase, catalytic region n=2 Tax=Anabaena variabilis TaxID=264691 RepID=Q3M2F7_TRIV2|nr:MULTISPECIES: DDE-type integrase/transposase/recombinase [Nostocaceae]ABA22066.1 Integrase, catalytic region [Trichormus variabilis ATCC 29413]ABA24829.1 Integrase, catalytic region [Trichormus variabilis ATCC 29413]ABA25328.1 Integrase, catalytic region [Trichormus variabilis ATCC 29413]MBC1213671.1 transposase [Trichormus variabilis ARAD]MBC1259537.1 transposase [Trichormus variabilis V5]